MLVAVCRENVHVILGVECAACELAVETGSVDRGMVRVLGVAAMLGVGIRMRGCGLRLRLGLGLGLGAYVYVGHHALEFLVYFHERHIGRL